MFSRASLVLALSLSAAAFGTGCASQSGEDVASDEGAATSSVLGSAYEGTIGNLKVMIHLDAQGSAVNGSYFYADKTTNGDVIKLTGTATGAKLTLNESVNGAPTGSFAGTISSTGITGTWKSPNGGATLPLALKPITAFKTVTRKVAEKAKVVPPQEFSTNECSVSADFIEVFGAGSAKADAAINAALLPPRLEKDASGNCDWANSQEITQEVKLNAAGFVSISYTTYSEGGAHPSVSISLLNFKIADGSAITGKDMLAPGADTSSKVKALVIANINSEYANDADSKKEALEALDQYWPADNAGDLELGLTPNGIQLDMTNDYPHVILALAPSLELKWADIKSLLKPGTPIAALAK